MDPLLRSDIETKRHWIARMDAARKEFMLQEEEEEEEEEIERFRQLILYAFMFLHQWV